MKTIIQKTNLLITMLTLVVAMLMPKTLWAQTEEGSTPSGGGTTTSDETITQSQPTTGDGSEKSPYQISTAGELMWFMKYVSETEHNRACCELTADIVLNTNLLETVNAGNTPANAWIMPSEFYGTFDGNGHTISGIYMLAKDSNGTGMFAKNYGTIKEVGVLDSYFHYQNGYYYIGTFAGKNHGSINDCYSFAKIVGSYYSSGIAGDNVNKSTGIIANCFFAGEIETIAPQTSSPITDDMYNYGTVVNCYYLSTVAKEGMTITRSTSCTEEIMQSGAVACKLRLGRNASDCLWGQEITNETRGTYPVLSGRTVYATHLHCNGMPYDDATFSNEEETETKDDHNYVITDSSAPTCTEDGYNYHECSICGHEYTETVNATGHKDSDEDGCCDNCNSVYPKSPVLVTTDNYSALGLSADYIGYYAIKDRAELYYFAESMNRQATDYYDNAIEPTETKFVLANDITVNENVLKADGTPNELSSPIVWNAVDMVFYNDETEKDSTTPVIFDGNWHKISGLWAVDDISNGFISRMSSNVTIKNLKITDSFFWVNNDNSGAIAGYSYGNIENCSSDITILNNNYTTGGIAGIMNGGRITGCSFSGNIYGRYLAGIVGTANSYSLDCVISDCHFSGNLYTSSANSPIGGIACYLYSGNGKITLEKCHANGKTILNATSCNVAGLFNTYYKNNIASILIVNNLNSMSVEDNGDNNKYYGLFDYADGLYSNDLIALNVNASKDTTSPFYNFIGNMPPQANFSLPSTMNVTEPFVTFIVTEEQMASGMVAYALNEYNKNRLNATADVWYQLIGEEAHPVLKGDEYSVVYVEGSTENPIYYNKLLPVDSYTLTDGNAYEKNRKTLVTDFTYSRTFSDSQVGKWQAMYVPFSMSYSDWSEHFDVAAINNFHEYTDEDGKVTNVELEVRLVKKGSIKANRPCLIRPKKAGDVNITLSNVLLEKAQEVSVSCSSVETKYTFTGTYQPITALKTKGYIFLNGGQLCEAANDEQQLKAQRWYLTRENLGSYLEEETSSSALSRPINIRVIDGETTGIEEIGVISSSSSEKQSATGIYDLQGRKLSSVSKGINIVRQSDGSVRKMMVK